MAAIRWRDDASTHDASRQLRRLETALHCEHKDDSIESSYVPLSTTNGHSKVIHERVLGRGAIPTNSSIPSMFCAQTPHQLGACEALNLSFVRIPCRSKKLLDCRGSDASAMDTVLIIEVGFSMCWEGAGPLSTPCHSRVASTDEDGPRRHSRRQQRSRVLGTSFGDVASRCQQWDGCRELHGAPRRVRTTGVPDLKDGTWSDLSTTKYTVGGSDVEGQAKLLPTEKLTQEAEPRRSYSGITRNRRQHATKRQRCRRSST